jgi:hypothetical protein
LQANFLPDDDFTLCLLRFPSLTSLDFSSLRLTSRFASGISRTVLGESGKEGTKEVPFAFLDKAIVRSWQRREELRQKAHFVNRKASVLHPVGLWSFTLQQQLELQRVTISGDVGCDFRGFFVPFRTDFAATLRKNKQHKNVPIKKSPNWQTKGAKRNPLFPRIWGFPPVTRHIVTFLHRRGGIILPIHYDG